MIYQLKITMMNIEPPIWRRVLVDGESSLGDLHFLFQIVMGWTNSHGHEFRIGDSCYGTDDPGFDEFSEDLQDEELFTLEQAAPFVGVEFLYEYDLGDSWVHQVRVEEIKEPETNAFKPRCLAGERSCPPENVGGIPGYAEFLNVLADSDHPEYGTVIDWIGRRIRPRVLPDRSCQRVPVRIRHGRVLRFRGSRFLYLPAGTISGLYPLLHQDKRHPTRPGRYSALLRRYGAVRKQHAQAIGRAGLHLTGSASSTLDQGSPQPGGPSGIGIACCRWRTRFAFEKRDIGR